MNSKGATRKCKPEQSNDFSWKNVVFGKSKPAVTEEPNDDENVSNESEPHNFEESEKPESESELDADHINEPIVFIADDADKPISIDDLQAEIERKPAVTMPAFFETGDNDNDKKGLTVSEKLNKIIEMLENTTSQLTKKADGYDTSTKCLLEKINSNVIKSQIFTATPDTNYHAYELKIDKLASRINELETNLKLFISTTIDMHKTSSNLKYCISESEEHLKSVLQQIYNKI